MPEITRQKTFIFTDFQEGHNKYWRIYEYKDGSITTEWGPVGCAKPQKKTFSPHIKSFEKECAGKEKKGYKPALTIDSSTDAPVSKTNHKNIVQTSSSKTQKLVDLLIQTNIHNILSSTTLTYNSTTGLFATPLGVVTQDAIDEARKLLAKIGKYLKAGNKHTDDQTILNEYFMLIPQRVPRIKNRPSMDLALPDFAAVQQQSSILDSLQASLDVASKQPKNTTKSATQPFLATIDEVDDSSIIKKIEKLYGSTRQRMHASYDLDIKNVFKVQCKTMEDAFKIGQKIGNIQELWHGTKVGNVLSILAKGLIIPPSNASYCTGRAFGNGVYFSDQSTKSLNYAYGYWDGKYSNQCFMFLCDVAMGKSYTPDYSSSSLPKSGYDSTFAKAGKSSVANNEMIVYNTNQCNLKYLVEFGK